MSDPSTMLQREKIRRTIEKKNSPRTSVQDYIFIGKLLKKIKDEYSSARARGRVRRERFPELDAFNGADLSNSIRLYEALEGERDFDLLEVLGVADIRDFHSGNPTVIIRTYRTRKFELVAAD
ncbi:hypothetical protein [Maritimibacter dapengensis]|uniref:Uncharacterized protein n=1 Tax=Maritimibacter dapengensis TaxID=2836868 RepID=A0ABS6T381_9RHOB|nr:hypothetical protein [Maritimibacter dapengensis]MBV7378812.1 hypothetical protein [Maritimibacter dapengensis]